MPDIALRFHKDMLVLSSPVAVVLARQGFDVEHDLEFANLVEPEAVRAWRTARRRSCARACPWRAS